MISPSGTIVVRRENPPSSPDTFIATHPKFYTNTILIQEQTQDAHHAAFPVFFDCLYAQCSYKPWYQEENFRNVPHLGCRLRCVVKKGKKQGADTNDLQEHPTSEVSIG